MKKMYLVLIALLAISLLVLAGCKTETRSRGAVAGQAIAAGSCVGKCGGASGTGCYCDTQCKNYGDCCADYDTACGTTTTTTTTTPTSTTPQYATKEEFNKLQGEVQALKTYDCQGNIAVNSSGTYDCSTQPKDSFTNEPQYCAINLGMPFCTLPCVPGTTKITCSKSTVDWSTISYYNLVCNPNGFGYYSTGSATACPAGLTCRMSGNSTNGLSTKDWCH